jgi:hypothetical protein
MSNDTGIIHFPSDQQVEAAIKESNRQQSQARMEAPSHEAICAAIEQLRKSERGTACLKNFNRMLSLYGFGLDTANWQALATLHRAGAAAKQCLIRDLLEVNS